MSTSAPTDEVALPGYFDLALTGLETLTFTNISGLSHSVTILSNQVGASQGGDGADARTVTPPQPVTLSMSHVVLTSMDLWTWMSDTIERRCDPTTAKEGTLAIKSLGDGAMQKTWNLSSVYLSSVMLDAMGAGTSTYLTATLTLLVGSCKPM